MKYNNETLLEMVELYAEEKGFIASEAELSEQFDFHIHDVNETKRKLADDEVMLSEEFSYFSDALCKEGEIHSEQYAKYEYIGELSNER